jgi:hypothetical protein
MREVGGSSPSSPITRPPAGNEKRHIEYTDVALSFM